MPWARRSLIGGYSGGVEGEVVATMLINLRGYLMWEVKGLKLS